METNKNKMLKVKVVVKLPPAKVWELWTKPEHICKWNFASNDWHAPKAINDLKKDGRFVYTMAAKDGSVSFDFSGTYTNVIPLELIEYKMDDGRTAKVLFRNEDDTTAIEEHFEAESVNSLELQEQGWQAILNNFKTYAESL